MGKRGFSVTTWVLVAILMGALYMVGRTVTPPPPGPPEPPPVQKPVADPVAKNVSGAGGLSPAQRAAKMKEMEQLEFKKHGLSPNSKNIAQHPVKKFDPNTIEVSKGWTKEWGREPGPEGEKKMAEEVAKAKAELEAQRKLRASMPGGAQMNPAIHDSGSQPHPQPVPTQ